MRDEKYRATNITNYMNYVVSTQKGINTIDRYMDSILINAN